MKSFALSPEIDLQALEDEVALVQDSGTATTIRFVIAATCRALLDRIPDVRLDYAEADDLIEALARIVAHAEKEDLI